MRISMEMPDVVYGRLAVLADAREVKIADLIAGAVKSLIGDVMVPKDDRAKVRSELIDQAIAAHEAGISWEKAADRFGLTKSTLRYQAARREERA